MNAKVTLILVTFLMSNPANAAGTKETPEAILEKSQQQFYKNDHDGALSSLQKYFTKVVTIPKRSLKTKLRFLAIAAMGRIYLQYKHDPKGAVVWFQKLLKDQSLTDAEQDIVQGWIGVANDWEKLGSKPETASEKELFENAKKYYESGLKKQKAVMDPIAVADFSISSAYLVPFLVQFDKSSHVGEALFMMGDMRRRMWSNNEFWSENTYLSEAIRRFPNTPLAIRAYQALSEDVEFGYSGSSGEHIPQSWKDLLQVLKKIAYGKESATPPTPTVSATPARVN